MVTPKEIAARFHAMLKEKEGKYGRGFNKHLHHKTGISTGYLSEIIGGEKPGSQETQMKICDAVGYDYNELLIENKPLLQTSNVLKIDKEHADVIRLLQNKELALEINHMLVEIEKDDPGKLSQIKTIIDSFMPAKKNIKKRG